VGRRALDFRGVAGPRSDHGVTVQPGRPGADAYRGADRFQPTSGVLVRLLSARAAILTAALAASLCGAPGASAASRVVYSDPVWWPLHDEVKVDCTLHNPGCAKHHSFWGVDVVPTGQHQGEPNKISHAGVYAMGAGIAHIGEAHGKTCGAGGSTNFGTWVWIDHGGGVISRYGHFSALAVREGQAVAAGTRLGTVGTTGKNSNCDVAYTDIMLRKPGTLGPSVEFGTKGVGSPDGALFACNQTARQVWPAAVVRGVSRWDLVPATTIIPAAGSACLPSAGTTPATATKVKLTRAGSKKLTASWAVAASRADTVRVELAEYHPSTKAWDAPHHERWVNVAPGTTKTTFRNLVSGHRYRVRVWQHNAAGWSAPSAWVTVTAS
jgi:hypothetical protein